MERAIIDASSTEIEEAAARGHEVLEGTDDIAHFRNGRRLSFHVNFQGGSLHGARFVGIDHTEGIIQAAAHGAEFIDCKISRRLHAPNSIKFERCELDGEVLLRGEVISCWFPGCIWGHADLRGTKFIECGLEDQNWTSVMVSHDTAFRKSRVDRMTITRGQLSRVDEGNRPSDGQQYDMVVIDNVAKLREQFGGFASYLHSIMLLAWLLPYGLYVTKVLARESLAPYWGQDPADIKIPLYKAIWIYIYTGGSFDGQVSLSFFAFCILFFYNVLRAFLLGYTLYLEHQLRIYGKVTKIPKEQLILWLNAVMRYVVYAALSIAAFHIYHFASRLISAKNAL